MPFGQDGQLPLEVDPKVAWARLNLAEHPIEINRAEKQELLRIPGIGPKSANAILSARINLKFSQSEQLHAAGVNLKRAAPYILLNGKRPAYQVSFL
jgi:predicted DNA-binding helix-hairpin-helix protein